MKAEALGFLALLILDGVFVSSSTSQAAVLGSDFELGYGPTTMLNASVGTPVYSFGDSIWVSYLGQSSVRVYIGPVNSGTLVANATLQHGVPTPLHTFLSTDPAGPWAIRFFQNSSLTGTGFLLSDGGRKNLSLSLGSYGFSTGALVLNLTAKGVEAIDGGELCGLGNSNASETVLNEPASLGGGTLNLFLSGDTALATLLPSGNESFSFWFELYHDYSYTVGQTLFSLVTHRVRVADSQTVHLSSQDQLATLSFVPTVNLRPGRYEVRAFFRSASGLSVAETRYLLTTDGRWVSLAGCQGYPLTSNSASLTLSLQSDPLSWGRSVYAMYRINGVEGYDHLALGLKIASVSFVSYNDQALLTAYTMKENATGAALAQFYRGVEYLSLTSDSASLDYSLSLGNGTFFRGKVTQVLPFTAGRVLLNASRTTVRVLNRGRPVDDGEVTISNIAGTLERSGTDSGGRSSFLVPSGDYTVVAVEGNLTVSQSIHISANQDLNLDIELSPQNATPISIIALLVGILGIGAMLNIWAWRRGTRFARSKGG